MNYEYLVVPFIGQVKGGVFDAKSAQQVSAQLQAVINEYVQKGWEYYRIDKVNIEVAPGCLSGLLGQKATYLTFDQVIFRRASA